jgi:hypothetical protein
MSECLTLQLVCKGLRERIYKASRILQFFHSNVLSLQTLRTGENQPRVIDRLWVLTSSGKEIDEACQNFRREKGLPPWLMLHNWKMEGPKQRKMTCRKISGKMPWSCGTRTMATADKPTNQVQVHTSLHFTRRFVWRWSSKAPYHRWAMAHFVEQEARTPGWFECLRGLSLRRTTLSPPKAKG